MKFIKKILKTKGITKEGKLKKLDKYPPLTIGYTDILGKPFKFHDRASFIVTYKELFVEEIYKFLPKSETGIIIDCGANIGLSVLYFSLNYPKLKIIAFEPQYDLFLILEENVRQFDLKNVELHNNAVWNKNEQLKFYTDGGMGGRVNCAYLSQEPTVVEAVPLKDYLDGEIEFLKIDIEGAEDTVLRSCVGKLSKINHIFFEYHNTKNQPQNLHQLLELMKNEGFEYYIKESAIRYKPFIDTLVICETFNMALNVFCYKNP
ncbi:MAG TPA: FkbM family methyltransferase [Pedobacter sp.]|jgi:FkbM family methyltransferase